MYIKTKKELKEALAERKSIEIEIRKKIDCWAENRYGISGLSEIKDKHMPFLKDNSKPYGFLARQIPSVCTEDLACFIGSKKIGLESVAMSFVQDSFSSANAEKLNRVKIPWSKTTKKGRLVIHYENISTKSISEIESCALDSISVKFDKTLPEFHKDLRQKVFGEKYQTLDISKFWSECLEKATNKPEFVYDTTNGKAKKIFLNVARLEKTGVDSNMVRPPSGWYYPLYFSCFLDGLMVLLETYENPNGEVPEAKKLFSKTMEEVKEIAGVYPLVLEIPPLLLEMRCINRDILNSGSDDWMKEIDEKVPFESFEENGNLCLFFKEISENILKYRK